MRTISRILFLQRKVEFEMFETGKIISKMSGKFFNTLIGDLPTTIRNYYNFSVKKSLHSLKFKARCSKISKL